MEDVNHKYDDIIGLPHHVSEKRRQMTMLERAGQFSAFEALTGLDERMDETARLTDSRLEPDDERSARIDTCLQYLADNAADKPEVRVVYYAADQYKSGGAYLTCEGQFKRIDEYTASLVLTDGSVIPIHDIWDISVKGSVIT